MIDLNPFVIIGDWDSIPVPEVRIPIIMPPIPTGIHGGGWHRSTQSTLEALSKEEVKGKTVLDLGAGTGIISVAAAGLGAKKVYATEIDPRAVEFAAEVFRVNDVEVWWLDPGAYTDWPDFDLALCNISMKALKLRANSPPLQRAKLVVVDGTGTWITMEPTTPGGKEHIEWHRPDPGQQTVEMLKPEASGMPVGEAARHLLANVLGIEVEDVGDYRLWVGPQESHISLKDAMTAKRREIQEIMDIQFGPGVVVLDA